MNRRVLLIDSDLQFRDALTHQLGRYRVVVMTEPDADRALALANADLPDLVVIGVEEPEKLGYKTFQKARKAIPAKIPIMLVTATLPADSFAKHAGMKVHADDYLDKRTEMDQLIQKVSDMVGDLGEPEADDDIPIAEDIELGDGDVVLDEQLDDDDVGSFANEQKDMSTVNPGSEVLVDSMVAQETDAAFDALLGDDMFGGGGGAAAPEPIADSIPEPVEAAAPAPEPIDDGIPEPVPHAVGDDVEAAADQDSVPAPIRDGGRQTGDALPQVIEDSPVPDELAVAPATDEANDFASEEAAPVDSMSAIPIADDDLVSLDEEVPVEVAESYDAAPAPEPAPAPAPAPVGFAPAVARSAAPPSAPAPTPMSAYMSDDEDDGHEGGERTVIARMPMAPEPAATMPMHEPEPEPEPVPEPAKTSGSGRHAVDLGLDNVAQEAEREQSGMYDHKGLRKIGELERQIAQLKSELERARSTADQAATGGREAQFLKLREGNLAKDKELKQLKASLEQHAHDLGEVQRMLEVVQHAKAALEAKNQQLEDRLFNEGGKEKELAASLEQANARLAQLDSELQARTAATTTAQETVARLERELAAERANAGASEQQRAQQHAADLAARDAAAAKAQEVALAKLREELEAMHAARLDAAIEELREANAGEHTQAVDALAQKHAAELAARDAAHVEALAGAQAALAQARSEHEAELGRHTAAHEVKLVSARRELDELGAQHLKALADARAQHDAELARREQAAADQRAKLEAELAKAAEAVQRTAESYEARIAELAATAQRETADVRGLVAAAHQAAETAAAKHAADREELERAHAAALAERHAKQTQLEQAHAAALASEAAKQAQQEQAHAAALAEQAAKHERALAAATGDAAKVKAAADAEHAKAIAALKAEMQQQIADLQSTHAQALADITTERDELKKGLSGARDSLKRSEAELASAVQTIADRNADLRTHAQAIAERDQRITELRAEIEAIEAENANYQEQVLRAYQKIKTDEAMVARARKAMAIALTVLDDQGNPAAPKPET